jgi:hypothetical protein
MSLWRSLLLIGFACFSLLFGTAVRRQTPPAIAPFPVYPAYPDMAAHATLDRALAAIDPSKVRWLQTTLWQQASAPPLAFEAEGTYQAGPNNRMRLDLQTRFQGTRRRLQVVCDGQTLWEAEQADAEDWVVHKVNWQRVLEQLRKPETTAQARAAFYRAHLFSGPALLLESLKQSVTFTRQEMMRWHDRDVLLLTGVRPSSAANSCADYEPRQCRLVLDANTLWPLRVEWWGPAPASAGDIRLLALEFRQPVLHQPVANELFRFTSGQGPIVDRTEEWLGRLRPPVDE